ncbi:MAG: phytoene desaturase family protein [Ardenticatenaceae bacterium]|nr:phytoene desaturase family protein [Ardenticatenaceae bacterium]
MSKNDGVVIIGAGIGGMSAAIRLAAAGRSVTILEQNERVGGKMGQIMRDGYRWDTGPSVITMRHVFEDLFAAAGRKLDDYLTLEPLEPLTRYFYQDGTILDASADLPTMLSQIEALNPNDVEGYLAYLAYAARIHRITGPVFIYDQPPTPSSFLRVPFPDWFKVDGLRKMSTAIDNFVQAPQLRQLLGRFATYTGASPYLAPATLNVIAHVELNGGVWYPRGGVYAVAKAYERLAGELGVEIRTNQPVEKIVVDANRRIKGVEAAGELIPAAAVIANVDVATVYQKLLPQTPAIQKKAQKLVQMESSCSGFILLYGVEGTHQALAHHNIFFSKDYPAEFESIFKDGQMPGDPTIYAAITSKSDPDHAPQGCENWFILVNAPPLGANWDWDAEGDRYEAHILDLLAARGFDLRDKIRVRQRLTPHDLEGMTGAARGALYGTSSNSMWAAFRRPHNRSAEIEGLYFCGGTTHPGGGVPMVTLSGKVAAELIINGRS